MEGHSYEPKRPWWRRTRLHFVLMLGVSLWTGRWSSLAVPALLLGTGLLASPRRAPGSVLMLRPDGLTIWGVEMPWPNVERIESSRRFGQQRDVMVLERGIIATHAFGVAREFDLRRLDPEWRSGPIGDDIRRWAPHLLDAATLDPANDRATARDKHLRSRIER